MSDEPAAAPREEKPARQQAAAASAAVPAAQARPGEQPAPTAAAEPEPAPPDAREAAKELRRNTPRSFIDRGNYFTGGSPSFGGSLVQGDQHIVSGGTVRDVHVGDTHIYQVAAARAAVHASGEIPAEEIDALAAAFEPGPAFDAALATLREQHVVVLLGAPGSGLRTAGLMLLRRAGARVVRALEPEVAAADLLRDPAEADGYLLHRVRTTQGEPLSRLRQFEIEKEQRERGRYLVVTATDPNLVRELRPLLWKPPKLARVLSAQLRSRRPDAELAPLLALEPVAEFVEGSWSMAETADFAALVADHDAGAADAARLAEFGGRAVRARVDRWFGDTALPLREKAFLLALAVFDEAPYALTVELSDQLYRALERIAAPDVEPGIEPFGDSVANRVQLAGARVYGENEETPWGPVPQRMAAFRSTGTASAVLRDTWTGHPSARPALVEWVHELAADPRPLVRTRAAWATALLATEDLSSVMGRLLLPWSVSPLFQLCLQAANALALAHYAGLATVPRILRMWSGDADTRRRWTAIRCFALIGDQLPEAALEAVAAATERLDAELTEELTEAEEQAGPVPLSEWELPYELAGLIDALVLLLFSAASATVLEALTGWLDGGPALRLLALCGLLGGAAETTAPAEDGATAVRDRPVLLELLAAVPTAAPGAAVSVTTLPPVDGPTAVHDRIVRLWRAALADRLLGRAALEQLRRWITDVAWFPDLQEALIRLLQALAESDFERSRMEHLLRSVAKSEPDAAAFCERVRATGHGGRPAAAPALHP
ncbi:hypothetical protein [Streptacidiphilus rugosus]|uniref:hypothetical protein n=1 Tax=Streptacidiphilus rugosus TaxID=405783 RepID=UPI0006924E18|nr:hypothetical protein [Streptacidiphilus rugosus]